MLKRICRLLLPDERKMGIRVVCAVFLCALLDFAGLAALLPVLFFLLDDGRDKDAALLFCLVAIVFILVKNALAAGLSRFQNHFLMSLYRRLSFSLFTSYYQRGLLFIRSRGSIRLGYEVNYICYAFSLNLLSPLLRMTGELLLVFWVTAALLVSCSKVPDGILSEKEMKAVLIDMQLAEAMISTDYKKYSDDAEKDALYQSVFRKHKIEQAVYDSSLVWYGRNLDVYMQVYDLVLAELNERQKALGDVQANAAPVSKQDSVDIWPRLTYLTLEPNALFNGIAVDIKPETNYPSGSTFVLGMRVWGLNDAMKNRPEIRLSANQGDTIITVNDKILRDGYHETTLRTLPTKQVKSVYGFIRLNGKDDSTSYFKIYVDSLSLMRYNYGRLPEKDSIQVARKDSIKN